MKGFEVELELWDKAKNQNGGPFLFSHVPIGPFFFVMPPGLSKVS